MDDRLPRYLSRGATLQSALHIITRRSAANLQCCKKGYSLECVEGEFSEVRFERRPGPRCFLHFGVAVRFAPLKRCAGLPPVRAWLPLLGRAHRFVTHVKDILRARSSHRLLLVGSEFPWLAGSGPSLCPVPIP